MPSFDAVNYSLRPSKGIQRQIIFDGIQKLQQCLNLEKLAYVGFGSIWFTDFVLAHKLLGIDDMVSIESNNVGYRRAVFNSPYATVRVMNGLSGSVLPTLYHDEIIKGRPWMIWLDYDSEFNEDVRDDIRSLIENAPTNSIVIFTFNGNEMKYGKAHDRPARLRDLFGTLVPDDLPQKAYKNEKIQETLADFSLEFMRVVAAEISRPGGLIPAFRIIYSDSAPMVTVGGVLPAKGAVGATTEVVSGDSWACRPERRINAPLLTLREAVVLQSELPQVDFLTRDNIQTLGFDLEEGQIETFQRYYKQYPTFAQILA